MDPTDGYSYPFNQTPPPLEIPDPSAIEQFLLEAVPANDPPAQQPDEAAASAVLPAQPPAPWDPLEFLTDDFFAPAPLTVLTTAPAPAPSVFIPAWSSTGWSPLHTFVAISLMLGPTNPSDEDLILLMYYWADQTARARISLVTGFPRLDWPYACLLFGSIHTDHVPIEEAIQGRQILLPVFLGLGPEGINLLNLRFDFLCSALHIPTAMQLF